MPEKQPNQVLNASANIAWNEYVFKSVRERALDAERRDPAAAARAAEAVWDTTVKECDDGVCVGVRDVDGTWRGFTLEELDAHRWVGGID